GGVLPIGGRARRAGVPLGPGRFQRGVGRAAFPALLRGPAGPEPRCGALESDQPLQIIGRWMEASRIDRRRIPISIPERRIMNDSAQTAIERTLGIGAEAAEGRRTLKRWLGAGGLIIAGLGVLYLVSTLRAGGDTV